MLLSAPDLGSWSHECQDLGISILWLEHQGVAEASYRFMFILL